jgi:tetratricopeptide (TPR) repeat protein
LHKIFFGRPSIWTRPSPPVTARSHWLSCKRPLYIRSSVCSKRKRRAIAPDGADAEARSCLGWALQARGELEGALVEIERGLAMSPNLAVAHWQRGATLIFSGLPKEGLEALETCIRLDPRDPFMAVRLLHIACGLYFAREYEGVIEAAKRLIRSEAMGYA